MAEPFTTFTSTGQLLGSAVVGAVAASAAGAAGYDAAFAMVGVLSALLLVAAMFLKSREAEARPAEGHGQGTAETAHA